jgi:nucleotide-binding universal stress UspA family protein
MPVITAMLILMCLMALLTDYIGVHTVLGAFVVGILIGQSPILTKHIEEQFRGLIVALFAPIFFAVAGLAIDLSILKSFYLIKLALGLILIACFGKLVGCYIGGRLGRLSSREATALAIGMNARGSTEVIVATIGLSMGVLSRDIFTLIVVMAITTTMITPPLLRWALTRIPPTGEEKERIEKEKAEARDFVPHIERLLITVDKSQDGKLASMLAGLFAGSRQVMSTVLELSKGEVKPTLIAQDTSGDLVKQSVESASRLTQSGSNLTTPMTPVLITNQASSLDSSEAVLSEAKKGYDMIFLGIKDALGNSERKTHDPSVEKIIQNFSGATAIASAKGNSLTKSPQVPMNILVPTTGTDYSRRAAEIAIAIARASHSPVTALHVSPPTDEGSLLRHPLELRRAGRALVKDIKELGEREGVSVKTLVKVRRVPEAAIVRQIERGKHNLVVLGVKARPGERLYFGHRIAALLESTPCSVLVINS